MSKLISGFENAKAKIKELNNSLMVEEMLLEEKNELMRHFDNLLNFLDNSKHISGAEKIISRLDDIYKDLCENIESDKNEIRKSIMEKLAI